MAGFGFSSSVVQGAIGELRLLASCALARAVGEPAEAPAALPHLVALLMPEDKVTRPVQRRGERMNRVMLFAAFIPNSPFQHRVLASGIRSGFLERLVARFRRTPPRLPAVWTDATVHSALAAPAFLAEAQGIAYRGLRRRVLFVPGGPPVQPISVPTLLTLIVWAGRPEAVPVQAWTRLDEVAQRMEAQPGWAGPTDRLLLAEAKKTFGRGAADGGQGEKGMTNVSG